MAYRGCVAIDFWPLPPEKKLHIKENYASAVMH
jgi:hypothetical protein